MLLQSCVLHSSSELGSASARQARPPIHMTDRNRVPPPQVAVHWITDKKKGDVKVKVKVKVVVLGWDDKRDQNKR